MPLPKRDGQIKEPWTHNVAYHRWVLRHLRSSDRVLDVGCGNGLLLQKIAESGSTSRLIGIEPHQPSAEKSRERLRKYENAEIFAGTFDDWAEEIVDAVIFVASVHHMDFARAVEKARGILAPGGRLLIVGCARPDGFADYVIEGLRMIPAKIGSILHGEKNGGNIGVPTKVPEISLEQVRTVAKEQLPGVRIRRGLYYRYLLEWTKES